MTSKLAIALGAGGVVFGTAALWITFVALEAPVPSGSASIEGDVVRGAATESPVGSPFTYGVIRIQDADDAQSSGGIVHWNDTFGDPNVVIRTARGERRVRLPNPARWRVLDGSDDSRVVASLEGLPLIGRIDVHEMATPPFRVTASVVRVGDHLILPTTRSRGILLYRGARAEHVALRRRHESGRWPMVLFLSLMSVFSLFAARRAMSGSFFDDAPEDEDLPAT